MARNNRSSSGGRVYVNRFYRYRVEYVSTDGRTGLVFGETDQPDGGMPLAMARRTPWVRTATVVRNQTAAAPLVRRAAA